MTNDLVVYKPRTLDTSEHIHKLETPVSKLNPETRIVSDEGMYAGGFYGLELHPQEIKGVIYVRFLQARDKGESSLLERMTGKVWGSQAKEIDDNYVVEHDGERYEHIWQVSVGSNWKRTLFDGRYDERQLNPSSRTLAELKTALINRRNLSVSNEFLRELFEPLFAPVIQTYHQLCSR